MNTITAPVAWQNFGEWALTGQHGMRPIYLSVMRGKLCARDAATDRRVPLTPESPVAQDIVKAVNAHAKLMAFLNTCALDRDDRISPGLKHEASQLLQAIVEGAP